MHKFWNFGNDINAPIILYYEEINCMNEMNSVTHFLLSSLVRPCNPINSVVFPFDTNNKMRLQDEENRVNAVNLYGYK